MKKFNVYVYFPASELEFEVEAESLKEALEKADISPNKLLGKNIAWNDSTGKQIHVTGILELGALE